jgi:anti-anti-sigma regulatory factor
MGQRTLRITIDESAEATVVTVEGRVAGPWAVELGRVWEETAPRLTEGKIALDISNVIYADDDGMQVLRMIYSQVQPAVLANTPWTRHLAEQITANHHDHSNEDQGDEDNE